MDTQHIHSLLAEVHAFEGLLIRAAAPGSDPETAMALPEGAARLQTLLTECGLLPAAAPEKETSADDFAKAFASMYGPEEEDHHTDTEASATMADSLLPPDNEGEYYEDDEDGDSLEIFEDEEEEDAPASAQDTRPDLGIITINERARFRNHLFGGSKEEFDLHMERLQQFRSYSEAEDYFCNDLEWTPETDDVQAEFLAKIEECFRVGR